MQNAARCTSWIAIERLRLSCIGAGRKIIRCEVSVDGNRTWRLGDICRAGPPNAYGKHWAWVLWSLHIPLSTHPLP